ncbi:hypothetical protein ABZ665_31420, partial [Streptomyces sp. NPDC007049]
FAVLLKFHTRYGRFPRDRSEVPDRAVDFLARTSRSASTPSVTTPSPWGRTPERGSVMSERGAPRAIGMAVAPALDGPPCACPRRGPLRAPLAAPAFAVRTAARCAHLFSVPARRGEARRSPGAAVGGAATGRTTARAPEALSRASVPAGRLPGRDALAVPALAVPALAVPALVSARGDAAPGPLAPATAAPARVPAHPLSPQHHLVKEKPEMTPQSAPRAAAAAPAPARRHRGAAR